MAPKNLWYVKIDGQVSGPFPSKLISQRVLLGRWKLTDSVSADQENWQPIGKVAELVPDLFKMDQKDPFVQERIAAARRWSDDRGGRDRRDRQTSDGSHHHCQRSGRERRQGEALSELNYREERDKNSQDGVQRYPMAQGLRKNYTPHSIVLLCLVIVALYGAYMYWPRVVLETDNNCEALAAPKVNWSNCDLQGIDLSALNVQGAMIKNANLTGANLKGVNLSHADLSYSLLSLADLSNANLSNSNLMGASLRNADLTNADMRFSNLSYTNFSGAVLSGMAIEGSRLDKAIWFDGRECAVGSLGRCD